MENDFLKNLDGGQVHEMVDSMYPREFEKGSYVIREGDAGGYFLFLPYFSIFFSFSFFLFNLPTLTDCLFVFLFVCLFVCLFGRGGQVLICMYRLRESWKWFRATELSAGWDPAKRSESWPSSTIAPALPPSKVSPQSHPFTIDMRSHSDSYPLVCRLFHSLTNLVPNHMLSYSK